MFWCCSSTNKIPIQPHVIENHNIQRFLAQHSAGSPANSRDNSDSHMTTAKRQAVLELHKRRIRIAELQNAIADERCRVDDLILEIAIT